MSEQPCRWPKRPLCQRHRDILFLVRSVIANSRVFHSCCCLSPSYSPSLPPSLSQHPQSHSWLHSRRRAPHVLLRLDGKPFKAGAPPGQTPVARPVQTRRGEGLEEYTRRERLSLSVSCKLQRYRQVLESADALIRSVYERHYRYVPVGRGGCVGIAPMA